MKKENRGIYHELQKATTVLYNPSFNLKDIEEIFNYQKPKKYFIPVSSNGYDLWGASVEYSINPSQENKNKLDNISDRITKESNITITRNKVEFERLYGRNMLEFIISISNPKHTLWMGVDPFYFRWEVKWNEETEDYWTIKFYKGAFNYVLEECAGYGEYKTLEADISKERVLELLNK